jgi:hypothetical protein
VSEKPEHEGCRHAENECDDGRADAYDDRVREESDVIRIGERLTIIVERGREQKAGGCATAVDSLLKPARTVQRIGKKNRKTTTYVTAVSSDSRARNFML